MQDPKFVLTHAGVRMPRLIYGTAWKKEQTHPLVAKALRYGFRGIDTACQPKHYHEAGVGEALAELQREGLKREDIFIQTKFTPLSGHDPLRIPYDRNASLADQVSQSFAVSQNNLGTNYVDSLVLHSPYQDFSQLMTVWGTMEKIHANGGARQLGISNCYNLSMLKQLYAASKVKPAVLQNRFYSDTNFDTELRAWCQEHHIIYQSFWTLTANPQILNSPVVRQLSQSSNRTPPQIFFRFLIQIGIVPLTGTRSDQHMKEDLEVFDFTFSEADVQKLKSLIV